MKKSKIKKTTKKDIKWKVITGNPSQVLPKLKSSLRHYRKNYSSVYVGITNDPKRRFTQHKAKLRWNTMVVKYSSSSTNYVRKIEKELDSFALNRGYGLENRTGGGGGQTGEGKQYLYFLLCK